MTEDLWTAVDRYLGDLLVSTDPALEAALAASAAAGLPAINVSPVQGKLLHLLARAIGARNILEIGTLGGYSTIWLARALPDGGRAVRECLIQRGIGRYQQIAEIAVDRGPKVFCHDASILHPRGDARLATADGLSDLVKLPELPELPELTGY